MILSLDCLSHLALTPSFVLTKLSSITPNPAHTTYTMSKPSFLGLGHASTAKKSSRDRREPSGGAFTMFTPQQVKQFKEAFNMIDQDGDGRVTEEDLKVMLSNLGE
jgi:myosin regulatory light chain 12